MNFEAFVSYLNNHLELAQKMKNAQTPDEAYTLAKDAGLDMSQEDFAEAMIKVNDAYGVMNADDVDAIVGGSNTSAIVSAAASTAGAAATGVGTVVGAAGAAV